MFKCLPLLTRLSVREALSLLGKFYTIEAKTNSAVENLRLSVWCSTKWHLSMCCQVWWLGMGIDQVDKAGSLCQTPTSRKIQMKFYLKCNNKDLQGQDLSLSVSIPLSTNPQISTLPPTTKKGPNATKRLYLWDFILDDEDKKPEETSCWNLQQLSTNLQCPQNSCSDRVAVVVASLAVWCPRTEVASPSCEHHHHLLNSKSTRKLPPLSWLSGKETNTQEWEPLLYSKCADCRWGLNHKQ